MVDSVKGSLETPSWQVPPPVLATLRRLREAGYAAYIVGGAVRDLLRGVKGEEISDWDLATSAWPDEVLRLFPEARPTGVRFGTVTLPVGAGRLTLQITAFRAETGYADGRHPDQVRFGVSLEEDLARRDFTLNALAWDPERSLLVDPFGGREDLARGLIRAVGEPAARLAEDYLRMLRAVRLATTLHFTLEAGLLAAIQTLAPHIMEVAGERVREELEKILLSDPERGLELARVAGLLEPLLPELPVGRGLERDHGLAGDDIYTHSLRTCAALPEDLALRWAGLLHDLAKPCCRVTKEGSFAGHAAAGAVLAQGILGRLCCPRALRERVARLIRWHMLVGRGRGEAAIRRFLARVGPDLIPDLLTLRRADLAALGGGAPDAAEDLAAVARVWASRPPLRQEDLAVGGRDLVALGIPPGPAIGHILRRLLAEVLAEPGRNTRAYLERRARELAAEEEEMAPRTLRRKTSW